MRTYKCSFGNGVSCEIKVTNSPPELGSKHIKEVVWDGEFGKWTIRPYIAWMNSVNKSLADEWGIKLMHVYMISQTEQEAWVYAPGKPPKKVAL